MKTQFFTAIWVVISTFSGGVAVAKDSDPASSTKSLISARIFHPHATRKPRIREKLEIAPELTQFPSLVIPWEREGSEPMGILAALIGGLLGIICFLTALLVGDYSFLSAFAIYLSVALSPLALLVAWGILAFGFRDRTDAYSGASGRSFR